MEALSLAVVSHDDDFDEPAQRHHTTTLREQPQLLSLESHLRPPQEQTRTPEEGLPNTQQSSPAGSDQQSTDKNIIVDQQEQNASLKRTYNPARTLFSSRFQYISLVELIGSAQLVVLNLT